MEFGVDTGKLVNSLRSEMVVLKATLDPREIATVELSRGLFAIIDRDMATEVNRRKWHSNVLPTQNAAHARAYFNKKVKTLQRFVAELEQLRLGNLEKREQITFKNKLSLDCRTSNLDNGHGRQAAMRNRRGKKNTSSQYKGVMQRKCDKHSCVWRAQIADIKNGLGSICLGRFHSEIDAALMYDAAAILMFEKSAFLNFGGEYLTPEILNAAKAKIERFKQKKSLL